MNEVGIKQGNAQRDAILEIQGIPNAMKQRLPVTVETEGFEDRDNIFLTSWESPDQTQKIVTTFTEGISTFTGDPVTRVQITSNGNVPDSETLKDVLAALVKAGEEKVKELGWHEEEVEQSQSPIILPTGSKREIFKALRRSNADELFRPRKKRLLFAEKEPLMRIHVMDEPEIVNALQAMDVGARKLGPHAMLPVSMKFKESAARPLKTFSFADLNLAPFFKLAA